MRSARRRLRPDDILTLTASSLGHGHCSFFATEMRISAISSSDGAGTRIPRQRERTGAITLEDELQINISRQCDEYLEEMLVQILYMKQLTFPLFYVDLLVLVSLVCQLRKVSQL